MAQNTREPFTPPLTEAEHAQMHQWALLAAPPFNNEYAKINLQLAQNRILIYEQQHPEIYSTNPSNPAPGGGGSYNPDAPTTGSGISLPAIPGSRSGGNNYLIWFVALVIVGIIIARK